MTPLQYEILTVLTEEAAEVIQECCKVSRFGLSEDNGERLLKEIAQLENLISLFYCHVITDEESHSRSFDYYQEKSEKMKTFTTYIKDVL